MSELAKTLDSISESVDAFKTTHERELKAARAEAAELRERIELLEAYRGRPKSGPSPVAPTGVKRYFTEQGEVVEVPGTVKLTDVMAPQKQEVPFERWLGALVAGDRSGDRDALKFVKDSKSVGTGSTGVLIPAEYVPGWVDLIRANSVLNRAGMTTATMAWKTQTRAAVTVDPTAAWHTEADTISATDPTFAARTLTAQTLAVRTQVSMEVAADSPDFGQQLAGVMARAMAAELDRVGLHGTGTPPEPRGIYNTSNINTVTSVGTLTDYVEIVNGVKELLVDNCPIDVATRYAIMHPATWARYQNLVTGISSDLTPLRRPTAIENMEFLTTTNASITLGSPQRAAIFLGDFSNLILGMRQEASVEILKATTYASNLLLEVIGYLRADYVVVRPNQFCVLTGVTP